MEARAPAITAEKERVSATNSLLRRRPSLPTTTVELGTSHMSILTYRSQHGSTVWGVQDSLVVDSSRRYIAALAHLPPKTTRTFHVEGAPDLVIDIFDLCSKIPYASPDEATRDKLWNEGLHLTRED